MLDSQVRQPGACLRYKPIVALALICPIAVRLNRSSTSQLASTACGAGLGIRRCEITARRASSPYDSVGRKSAVTITDVITKAPATMRANLDLAALGRPKAPSLHTVQPHFASARPMRETGDAGRRAIGL